MEHVHQEEVFSGNTGGTFRHRLSHGRTQVWRPSTQLGEPSACGVGAPCQAPVALQNGQDLCFCPWLCCSLQPSSWIPSPALTWCWPQPSWYYHSSWISATAPGPTSHLISRDGSECSRWLWVWVLGFHGGMFVCYCLHVGQLFIWLHRTIWNLQNPIFLHRWHVPTEWSACRFCIAKEEVLYTRNAWVFKDMAIFNNVFTWES